MGWDSEQAERGFDGYDDREPNYRSTRRRRGSYWTPPPLKPVPKTCRNCSVGGLRWVLTVKGYRLQEVVDSTLIPHFCDPVERAAEHEFHRQCVANREFANASEGRWSAPQIIGPRQFGRWYDRRNNTYADQPL